MRLNVQRECIDYELNSEASAVEEEEMMKSPCLKANEAERASRTSSP